MTTCAIRDLARAGAELADEVGVDGPDGPNCLPLLMIRLRRWTLRPDAVTTTRWPPVPTRVRGGRPPIARGVASINWGGVPPGIFDAAEDTVDWHVEATGTAVVAVVRAAVIGPDPATGITVLMRSEVRASSAQRRPGRRRPRHAAPGRRPAAATDRIGCLGPRLDEHLGDHRRRCRRVTRNARAGSSLGAATVRSAGGSGRASWPRSWPANPATEPRPVPLMLSECQTAIA